MRLGTFLKLCAISGALMLNCINATETQEIRQPAVAGAFYPADPKELEKMVDDLLARAQVPEIKEPVLAVVSPHAGYPYSGPVAAYSYAALKGRKFARVVVISPSHFEGFSFASVYEGDTYATPLGSIPVDKVFAAQLAEKNPLIKLSTRGHGQVEGRGEHSLEVELPFLQRTLDNFKLVPIVMGEQSYETSRALGVALAKLIQGGAPPSPQGFDTLIVASSDLSHYHPYDDAVRLDHKVLKAIEEWDYLNMSQNFDRQTWEACGGGPIVAAMIAAERLGANRALVLRYANSGDVTGDKSRVVGYGSVVLIKDRAERSSKASEWKLSQQDRDELMRIAKRSVETVVREGKLYHCSTRSEALIQERGAFVTLRKKGQLRGCIGYIAPLKPLCLTVRDVAAAAAVQDPRFPPVSVTELGELEYEISVLSPLRRVSDIKQIKVGQHGLVMKNGGREGLLLPQVPTEEGWGRKTFLEQTCVKAGLPGSAWQDKDTDIFQFTALVFGERRTAEPVSFPEPDTRRRPDLPGQQAPDLRHP